MKIEISDKLFKRLQAYAEPFVDSPETIIARALDALDKHKDPVAPRPEPVSILETYTEPKQIPSLKHTKIIKASIGKKNITGNWAEMLGSTLIVAMDLLKNSSDLMSLSKANIVSGKGDKDKGFEYIPEIGLSFQRCDADVTFKHIYQIVQELDLELDINFIWNDTPKATFPNCSANIMIRPNSQGIIKV